MWTGTRTLEVVGAEHNDSADAILDVHAWSMHDSGVPTKTISLELDAYDRLKASKRTPNESFSAVVRRAVWMDAPPTLGDILADFMKRLKSPETQVDEATLNALDAAQKAPRKSQSEWGT